MHLATEGEYIDFIVGQPRLDDPPVRRALLLIAENFSEIALLPTGHNRGIITLQRIVNFDFFEAIRKHTVFI